MDALLTRTHANCIFSPIRKKYWLASYQYSPQWFTRLWKMCSLQHGKNLNGEMDVNKYSMNWKCFFLVWRLQRCGEVVGLDICIWARIKLRRSQWEPAKTGILRFSGFTLPQSYPMVTITQSLTQCCISVSILHTNSSSLAFVSRFGHIHSSTCLYIVCLTIIRISLQKTVITLSRR